MILSKTVRYDKRNDKNNAERGHLMDVLRNERGEFGKQAADDPPCVVFGVPMSAIDVETL
jgi:hypothetical protein